MIVFLSERQHFRIFDMFCGGCCYPDTKEESGNQEQCSSREEINENPKIRPDTDTIEHQQNNTYFKEVIPLTYKIIAIKILMI